MASFTRRGMTWRASVSRHGRRATGTFDSKADAEAWAIKTEAEFLAAWRARADTAAGLPVEAARATSMGDLLEQYARDISPQKKGARWEKLRLNALKRDFPLFAGLARDVTPETLSRWRDVRLAQVSAHTVRRELGMISAVIKQAIREWGVRDFVGGNPVHAINRPKQPRPRKQRWSKLDQATLLMELGWAGGGKPENSRQYAAAAFCLALETAMRRGEVLGIRKRDIHLDTRHIHLAQTKNGDERDVPLSRKAMAIIEMLMPDRGQDFLIPLTTGHMDTIFRRARAATDLTHARFHDTRREAATNMSKKLPNVLELAAVTGHKSLDVLRRTYYQPNPMDLAEKLD